MIRFILIFVLFPLLASSQSDSTYNFNVQISTVVGDLNKDGLNDLAIVTQDTVHENAPYKLEVFFRQANDDLKLIVSSTKAIQAQFPNGRENHIWDGGFGKLSIHRGVLWIEVEFTRGHMEHKFRYQNEKFELIGYSSVYVLAGNIEMVDFNLSTGRRIEKEGNISEDDYSVVIDKIVKINPLPTLDEFEPYMNDLY